MDTGSQHPSGQSVRLRVYFGERDKYHGKALWSALLDHLRHAGAAGATVTRGISGFGAHSVIHAVSIVDLSTDLPLILEWIDGEELVQEVLPEIEAMLDGGLITIEPVTVVRYQPHTRDTERG